ncbi:MAG: hypothetical protein CME06_15435, partial [Gemmatimonadetes bacterium]|nr:hypothetical protein [Gemmatimonadota bacterium]
MDGGDRDRCGDLHGRVSVPPLLSTGRRDGGLGRRPSPHFSPTFVARGRRFVPWRCFAPFRAEACW